MNRWNSDGEAPSTPGSSSGLIRRGSGRKDDAGLEALLLETLPPLHRRVRRAQAAALASRLASAGHGEAGTPAELAAALTAVLPLLEGEVAEVEELAARFTRAHGEAQGPEAQRAVLLAHIAETVESRRERREDERALDRWMGFDALRERLDKRRHRALLQEETVLRCLAELLPRVPAGGLPRADGAAGALVDLLLARAERSPRVQNQQAALEGLDVLLRAHPSAAAALAVVEPLTRLVLREGVGPFLQALALQALVRADRAAGLALLRRRTRDLFPSPRDFLFRRQALELVGPQLPEAELLPLLEEVARTDVSEYVRMGVCGLLPPLPARTPLLRRLAGLEPAAPEASPRVRTSAVLAAVAVARAGGPGAEEACRLLLDVVREERHALPLRVTCEQVAALADADRTAALLAPLAPALTEALRQVRLREGTAGVLLETAAATEQVLGRMQDTPRRAWTRHLAAALAPVKVGGRTRLVVEPAPEGLPPLPEEPAFLGAILADLSQDDHGLYARRAGRTLTLWRGDRKGRRAWRVLYEVKRPAPNKRQGFLHTTGRSFPGVLRAHPAHLDEITETQVPGERVHVASQGGWGRHLPTVDDLLDLPLAGQEPVHLFSSHGVTTLTPPEDLFRRVKNRLRVTREYPALASLRLSSLGGEEARERRRFTEHVEQQLGVDVSFTPYRQGEPVPSALATLFGREGQDAQPQEPGGGVARRALWPALLPATSFLDPEWVNRLSDRLVDGEHYFTTTGGNGMVALGLFTAGAFTLFLGETYKKRQSVRASRARIPLCVGGWGTRGKSGTERLKAALFNGLGFEVFAKTTGSEAMFVHGGAGALPTEFFIFRPYDKATIWEQKDMVELAVKLGTEVFLWECMALQPSFVDLLQNDWMHDDLATLTNAYPDHEDIQGPAGADVASVITNFMPRGGKVITTEDHFLPLFKEQAKDKGTELLHSPWWEAELIPEELLALFPYREHPRNMALVATMAEQLGIPRPQALAMMAEHVQPEIGVLKVFPSARVRGRTLSFINGHSANERTGFLNNWRRTGLDTVDPDAHPDRVVLTVINNRWDRVARSEVFARIMVEDASADRHVLIGTNLEGLQKYFRDALDEFLARTEVVSTEDLASEAGVRQAEGRLTRELARLKVPRPAVATFMDRLSRYARGAGLELSASAELTRAVTAALSGEGEATHVGKVREALEAEVGPLLEPCLLPGTPATSEALPETLAPATAEDVRTHGLYLLARMAVHARVKRALPRAGGGQDDVAAFHRTFRDAYRELALEQLVPVSDPGATGDQVVDACARCTPPGVTASIMGSQNIKGTGLDWVYRWVAQDRVATAVQALEGANVEARRRALDSLEGFEDQGIVDSGLARHALPRLAEKALNVEEAERLRRQAERYAAINALKVAGLKASGSTSRFQRAVRSVEKAFDYLDSVTRKRLSEQLLDDLIHGRVSHARAAVETRKLYERQKGGWLLAKFGKGKAKAALPAPQPAPLPAGAEARVPGEQALEGARRPRTEVVVVPEPRGKNPLGGPPSPSKDGDPRP
jgi:poly-gamma-glutamate synthase PgsB/CapB